MTWVKEKVHSLVLALGLRLFDWQTPETVIFLEMVFSKGFFMRLLGSI